MKRVFYILFILFLSVNYIQAEEKTDREMADSLLKHLHSNYKKDTNTVLIYRDLTKYTNRRDPDNAIIYAENGLKLSKEINYDYGAAVCLNELGICYWYKSQYNTAKKYFNEALTINKKIGRLDGIAKNYSNLGIIATALSNFPLSLDYYLKALKINEKLDKKNSIAIVLSNIGALYDDQKDYAKGLEYHTKSLEMNKELKNYSNIAVNYENIGLNYLYQKNYSEALQYLNKSIELAKQKELWLSAASVYISLGDLNLEIGDFKRAVDYYKSSIEISNSISNKSQYSKALGKIGYLYLQMTEDSIINKFKLKSSYGEKQKLLKSSIDYSLKAAKISEMIGEKKRIIDWYKNLSDAYTAIGDTGKAFVFHVKWYNAKDSIFSFENQVKLADLAENRRNELKEKEILMLKNEKAYQMNLFIIGIIITFVLLLLISWFLRKQKKNNNLLKEKNQQIENANIELSIRYKYITESTLELEHLNESLLQRERQLEEVNSTKDKFFSLISHDLRTPFSGFLGLADLLANDAESLSTEDIKKMGKALYEAADSTFKMLNDLLEWSRIQTGTMQFNPDDINVNDVINSSIKTFISSASAKGISFEIKLEGELNAYADSNMLSAVIRNLISNAIKFTKQGGKIEVYSLDISTQIRVGVKDNGVGMSSDVLAKLFKIDSPVTTIGTNKEKGTGLGLILCKEFVEKHNGTLCVESKLNQGSHFYFTLSKSRSNGIEN